MAATTSLLDIGRQVLRDEAAALNATAAGLGDSFDEAVEVLRGSAQIVVTGLGKSGHVAAKIAATLTSTGSPAMFVHPVEALHGDLGLVTPQHCLLALSRSGSTEEVVRFALHFRRLGGPVIAVTQRGGSKLGELARCRLVLPDMAEVCPFNLAPTTSCVMQLALGDALAMALLHSRGFKEADFAQYHPEGALGRRLLLRASDLMFSGERLPLVRVTDRFDQLLLEMTRKQLGVALIVDEAGRLVGTFTDGDLRRLLERVENPRSLDARAAHSNSRRSPGAPAVRVSSVEARQTAVDCLQIMRDSQITSLVVLDEEGRPAGLLRMMELVNAGLG